MELQGKGFFVGRGRLLGNEGERRLVMADGAIYTIYFGELTFDSGLALTAGRAESSPAADTPEPEAGDASKNEGSRYIMVTVGWDPARAGDAASQSGGPAKGADAEKVGEPTPPARLASLQRRFDSYFFVTTDYSFKNIHIEPETFFRKASTR